MDSTSIRFSRNRAVTTADVVVEIAVAAQDKFGVEIPDDQLKDLKTVQDVIDYVKRSSASA